MFSLHSSPIGDLGSKDTGGMSVYIRELARVLGQKGHHVDIFTRETDPGGDDILSLFENVRLVFLKIDHTDPITKNDLYAHVTDFWQSADTFKRHHGLQYDIIHSHYWLSGCLGHLAQNRWETPHILMFHTLGAVKSSLDLIPAEPEPRLKAERQLALSCHRILVAAEKEKMSLERHYHVDQSRIGVVPCGVNLNRFTPLDRDVARRQLGLNIGEKILLYVGRFDPLKQIDRLIAAVPHIPGHRDVRLLIIGGDGHSDSELQRLKKLTAEGQIQSKVTFAGRIRHEDLPPYYCAADMLVVASAYESFGLVGLESLACGTPVVATPVGAMERIIIDGKSGRLLRDDRPRSIAEAVEDILTLMDQGGASAPEIRSTVRQYEWSAVGSAVLREYRIAIDSVFSKADGKAQNTQGLN